MSLRPDIAVVGGGLLGAPLAMQLARQGWSVALLDPALRKGASAEPISGLLAGPEPEADREASAYKANALRVPHGTALSPSSVATLQHWGVWTALRPHATPIRRVQVSQRGHFGRVRLDAADSGTEALGYVIANEDAMRIFRAQLSTLPGLRVLPLRVQQLSVHDRVTLETDAETVQAKLVLAVDGVNSQVADVLGIDRQHYDHDQCAVLCGVELDRDHGGVAHERFGSQGPLALLPRRARTMSVVWCMDPAQANILSTQDDAAFLAELQDFAGHRLGRFVRVTARQSVPLARDEARTQVHERVVLLGNAARLLHPVAGQGYNLAMRDAERLLSVLPDSGQPRADPGAAAGLEAFAAQSRADQRQTVRFTEALASGFRGAAPPLAAARALTLLGLDHISPARRRFADLAMGARGVARH